MKKLVAVVLLGVALVGCAGYNEDLPDMIRACVQDGGTPQYAVNKWGYVTDYFGCAK